MFGKEDLIKTFEEVSDSIETILNTITNQIIRIKAGMIPIHPAMYTNIIEVKEIRNHLEILEADYEILLSEKGNKDMIEVFKHFEEEDTIENYLSKLDKFIRSIGAMNNKAYDALNKKK